MMMDEIDYEFSRDAGSPHSDGSPIERYDMRDRVMSVVVTGVLEPVNRRHELNKALFSYNLGSEEECEEMVKFITNTFKEQSGGPDLDDLIDGLGISLN